MSKVSTLADAVSSISTGNHVALPGFATARCAMAFAHEAIRQGKKQLTVSQCVAGMDADMLVGTGVVERIVYGGGSRGRSGQHHCINRAIEQGTLAREEFSSLSMTFRYLAGSLGLPFIPIRSLNGSDILKELQEKTPPLVGTLQDPFTGDDWLVLKPLVPDVAIAQVQVADEEGNAWILGPRWDNEEQVKASKRTIVITEQLVSTELIRRYPERTLIHGFRVSHVVHLPFSAHPSSVYGVYDFDKAHIKIFAEASKTPECLHEYLDKYVHGVAGHWEYLEQVGGMKYLDALRADPILGY
jgi:acyl CoA:acetate/3-ketoacid CoA transferase alpha subunit